MLQSIGMGHFEIAGEHILVHGSPLAFLEDDDAAVEVDGRCAVGEGGQVLIRSTRSLIFPTTTLQLLLAARPTHELCGVVIDRVVELVYQRLGGRHERPVLPTLLELGVVPVCASKASVKFRNAGRTLEGRGGRTVCMQVLHEVHATLRRHLAEKRCKRRVSSE